MRIAVIGQAAFGKDVLESLVEKGEDVVAVLCPPDRKDRPFDPIKESAVEHDIRVCQYRRMRDEKAITEFSSLNIDLCVMAFVTDIVPMEILESPTNGTIQYHPSLLPEHRGPSSINWPIIQGKTKTGLSIFWPDEGLDTGPILLQKETPISPDDTLGSVYFGRLYPMGVEAMVEAVGLVKNGEAPKIAQDHSKSTYEGWCRSDDTIIDWNKPAAAIYNLIRGSDPSPVANANFGDDKLAFFNAKLSPDCSTEKPGTVMSINSDTFSIALQGGTIDIGRVQINRDRKIMANEFVESKNLEVGFKFSS